jgi:hypothetical protein
MLNDSDFEEMVDVDYQKRCEKVCSLIRNTTQAEFEEWLAFDNARITESLTDNEPRQAATSQLSSTSLLSSIQPENSHIANRTASFNENQKQEIKMIMLDVLKELFGSSSIKILGANS